jgi:hypothetical protein
VTHGDALTHGVERGLGQSRFERGQTHEHDLERPLREDRGVGERAQLVEQLVRERVRVVDDDHRHEAVALRLGDVALEPVEQLRPVGVGGRIDAEAADDVLEELGPRHRRAGEERGHRMRAPARDHLAHERRLPGPRFAGDEQEGIAAPQALREACDRLET